MKITLERKNIILIGSILIALRLFFPVLQCNNLGAAFCTKGDITFFTFNQPVPDYSLHATRTYSEAIGLAVLTLGFYFGLKSKKEIR